MIPIPNHHRPLSIFKKPTWTSTTSAICFDWAAKQCYIAMANMMTAAAALKIDSCPIEGFNREKVESYLAEKGVLDRQHWELAVMVSFGYRDEPIKPKSRQAISDIYRTIK